jgi:hypothetical protein
VRGTDDFRETSLRTWAGLLEGVFPTGIPSSTKWTNLASMSSVLNRIGSQPNSNHMFFPTGGGMDLEGSSLYEEEDECLALKTGNRVAEVVKPSALLFESFGQDLEWAYFRIECQSLQPSGVYEDVQKGERASEEVVLVEPGTYAPRSAWDDASYEGKDLPETARLIIRSLGGGALVIFAKGSAYNLASGRGFDAYDGRHAKMSPAQFRDYIGQLAERH